jgi:hypothetical protein
MRRLNAIVRVKRSSGEVDWKLGGTPTPKSLTIIGDPLGSFPLAGQHHARRLPDGTISIYDNGSTSTTRIRAPRVVRYRVDPVARTATFVSQITDPAVDTSPCCGSATLLANGNWVIAWGGTPRVTETDGSGRVLLALDFHPEVIARSYRAMPISRSLVSRSALVKAMDAVTVAGG